ncbi:MAG TPA: hypothetical protein VMV49_15655 [Candidatus Deferrimicrobium sp.]|nr:hypothetical protein [Candidatus Deferrimicrobium sp.]
MSSGRVVGGIIALIAGIFVIIECLVMRYVLIVYDPGEHLIQWILNLVVGFVAVVGGIRGLALKRGGIDAIVAGTLSLVLGILSVTVLSFTIIGIQYSLFEALLTIGPWFGITLETILIIVGAIIMLASGKGLSGA